MMGHRLGAPNARDARVLDAVERMGDGVTSRDVVAWLDEHDAASWSAADVTESMHRLRRRALIARVSGGAQRPNLWYLNRAR